MKKKKNYRKKMASLCPENTVSLKGRIIVSEKGDVWLIESIVREIWWLFKCWVIGNNEGECDEGWDRNCRLVQVISFTLIRRL